IAGPPVLPATPILSHRRMRHHHNPSRHIEVSPFWVSQPAKHAPACVTMVPRFSNEANLLRRAHFSLADLFLFLRLALCLSLASTTQHSASSPRRSSFRSRDGQHRLRSFRRPGLQQRLSSANRPDRMASSRVSLDRRGGLLHLRPFHLSRLVCRGTA